MASETGSCSCEIGTASGSGGSAPGAAAADGCGAGGACQAGVSAPLPSGNSPGVQRPATQCKCLEASTILSIVNGDCKQARALVVGDALLGPDGSAQNVTAVSHSRAECIQILCDGASIVCSLSHLLMASDGTFVEASTVEPGVTSLRSASGGEIAVLTFNRVGERDVVDVTCEPNHIYTACGLIHHNKPVALSREAMEL